HAVLGHQPAHGRAVTLVIILLDAEGFFLGDLQEIRDKRPDAIVNLLPEIEVVRIERVVEVEHPGLDRTEVAGHRFRRIWHAVTNALSACGTQDRTSIRHYLNCPVVALLPASWTVAKPVAVRPLPLQSLC